MRKQLIELKHLWLEYYLEIGCNTIILSKKTPKTKRTLWSDWTETENLKKILAKHDISFWDFRLIQSEAK